MSPEQINSHEPTAVKRDSNDQEIAEGGQTGTNTSEAQERYRKEGMTKVQKSQIILNFLFLCYLMIS